MDKLAEIQKVLTGAIDDLNEVTNNLRQSALENDKDALDRMVREHGLCNVVGFLADIAGFRVAECEDDSQAAQDWLLAEEVLYASRSGVDLRYNGDGYSNVIRRNAIAEFKTEAATVSL